MKRVDLSPAKARRILKEAAAGKMKLTPVQRGLLKMIAHGKKLARLSNPRLVELAPRVDAIFYSFGDKPHGDCDAECKRSGHRYRHDFEKDFPLLWDTATGRLII